MQPLLTHLLPGQLQPSPTCPPFLPLLHPPPVLTQQPREAMKASISSCHSSAAKLQCFAITLGIKPSPKHGPPGLYDLPIQSSLTSFSHLSPPRIHRSSAVLAFVLLLRMPSRCLLQDCPLDAHSSEWSPLRYSQGSLCHFS